MEKLLLQLIEEVENLKKAVRTIEGSLDRIEKELDIKKDREKNIEHFRNNVTAEKLVNTKINSNVEEVNTEQNNLKRKDFKYEYLFENLIYREFNELPYSACLKIAKQPGYNKKLIYIQGDIGMGKTHILKSIENYIEKNCNSSKCIYINIDNFINELIQSISQDKSTLFYNKFNEADVLLFDDLQRIINKERSQEELKKIINHALDMNKQVVVASTLSIADSIINGDEFDAVFDVTDVYQINKPSLEARIDILRNRVNEYEIELDEETIYLLSQNNDLNIRQLISYYNRVVSYINLTGHRLNEKQLIDLIQSYK